MEKPRLIEPGTRYFIKESLKNSNKFRTNYNNNVINVSLFVIFIIILGIFLFIRYKGKLTPLEKENKLNEQKTYILSKIKQLQDVKRQRSQELVTNLPKFDEYDYNKYYETMELCIEANSYALTGSVFSKDEKFIEIARNKFKHKTGNFYINDKSTGAVVGQQPFGGSGKSGTNDKAGDVNLLFKLFNQR